MKAGIYCSDDGGIYHIGIFENEVVWVHIQPLGQHIHLFKGVIYNQKLIGKWIGITDTHGTLGGELRFNVSENNFRKVYETTNIFPDYWTFQEETNSDEQYYFPNKLPGDHSIDDSVSSKNDLSGIWIDESKSKYFIIHSDNFLGGIKYPEKNDKDLQVFWVEHEDALFQGNYYHISHSVVVSIKNTLSFSLISDHTLILISYPTHIFHNSRLSRVRINTLLSQIERFTLLNTDTHNNYTQLLIVITYFHTSVSSSSNTSVLISDHEPIFYFQFVIWDNPSIQKELTSFGSGFISTPISTLPGFSPYLNEYATSIDIGIAIQAWVQKDKPITNPMDESYFKRWKRKIIQLSQQAPYRNANRYSLMDRKSLYLTLFDELTREYHTEEDTPFEPCGLAIITRDWHSLLQPAATFHLTLLEGMRNSDHPLIEVEGWW